MFKILKKIWKKYVVLTERRVTPKTFESIEKLWNQFRGNGHHWYDCDVDEIDNLVDKVIENWDTVFMGYHKVDNDLLPYHVWSLAADSGFNFNYWGDKYWFTKEEVTKLKNKARELSVYKLNGLYAHTLHVKYCSHCDPEAKIRLAKKARENIKMIFGNEPFAVVNLDS